MTGLGLAWKLCARGAEVLVLEQDEATGGLAKTIREKDCSLDMGPHSFFSDDREILNTVLDLFGDSLKPKNREVKFYYQGKYLDYPFTSLEVLFQMGLLHGLRAGISFVLGKVRTLKDGLKSHKDETVRDWAENSFGVYLYRTFFKPYTEQFWNIPCEELSADTIPDHTQMNFVHAQRLLLQRKSQKVDDSLLKREMLPTYYPDRGFGEIARQLENAARQSGASIGVSSRVAGVINKKNGRMAVRYETGGGQKQVECDHVVSTIPIGRLIEMLEPPVPAPVRLSASKLKYRSLVILGIVTTKQDILDASYIYTLNRPYVRISEMNKFSPATSPPGLNLLVVELPCSMGGSRWNISKSDAFALCRDSLASDGFLTEDDVEELILARAPDAYPVYELHYQEHLERTLGYLSEETGISTLGRTGRFMYMDVDRCLREAFNLAEELNSKWNKG